MLKTRTCGDKKEKGASQTAVKVNKSEVTVHQINFVLQQQRNIRPEQTDAASRQILELKDRIHRNSNLLRFLISEPLSVQFSVWRRQEVAVGRGGGSQCLTFNWVSHNAGGAVDDGEC